MIVNVVKFIRTCLSQILLDALMHVLQDVFRGYRAFFIFRGIYNRTMGQSSRDGFMIHNGTVGLYINDVEFLVPRMT